MHTRQEKLGKYKNRRKLQKKKTELHRPTWKSLWKWENLMILVDGIVMFTLKRKAYMYNTAQRFFWHCFTVLFNTGGSFKEKV